MACTYDLNSTSTSLSRSWVRLRIGDTNCTAPRLQDAEIDALLADQGSKYLAAAVAAETIGAGLAQRTDKTVGRLSISQSKASVQYFDLAKRLRAESAMRAGLYAGGISRADKQDAEADTDRVPPAFGVRQFDDHANTVDLST